VNIQEHEAEACEPWECHLLTDEVSYVCPRETGYEPFGRPFAGDLSRVGENLRTPVAALCPLAQGQENRIEPNC
jgi:hypothetical protein